MKEIKAVIQPQRLAKVRSAFKNVRGFPGMTVSKVEGCGNHHSKAGMGMMQELTDYTPKVRIEMVVPDEMLEGALQILVEVGHTGQLGDGLVWVTPVQRLIQLADKIIVHDC